MKMKKAADDWKSEEEDDEVKSEEWWPVLMETTDELSPEGTAKCSTPACQSVPTVHDYAFLNLINEGTYGVVYKAMHKKTGDVVAIKMLKSENQPQGVSSTGLREVHIMQKARHINVISLREVVYGNNIDKVYLVMEYAETDLKQLMFNMQRPFSVSETKCLLVQLLYAVQYLHEKDILHRDIKTENLLLNVNGILKVTDFGLARTFRKGDKHLSPVVVTLWYRAPELLLGSETYSTPVDLWSVGCVFAELLIGKPLWDGESEIDQLHQIFCDLGTPSEKIWPGYSRLPLPKTCILPEFPYNRLRRRLGWTLTELGLHLLNWFLTYSPAKRVTAVQALQHWYFQEVPAPPDPQFLAGQVFRSPVIYPQCFVQGSGEPQPTMVYTYPANINYAHG
ncbi:CDK11B [Branchiostoma lanceolatum]|uniref:CDK11B protein n=1 Tax=Branchiostoma lanceolatum TaxID=7740 RepID=A0A8K0EHW0_BRALA|nr:CDK11B [Branchiostoma lanceolatum]